MCYLMDREAIVKDQMVESDKPDRRIAGDHKSHACRLAMGVVAP